MNMTLEEDISRRSIAIFPFAIMSRAPVFRALVYSANGYKISHKTIKQDWWSFDEMRTVVHRFHSLCELDRSWFYQMRPSAGNKTSQDARAKDDGYIESSAQIGSVERLFTE